MLDTTTFVGLDVHARSIKAVSLDVMTGEARCATFGYDAGAVAGWVRSVDPKARCVYESGVTGFDLQKRLSGLGVDCAVGAVSKMIKPSADRRRKNDRNDAEFLARMLSVGNVVEVWVPDDECEAARDPGRSRTRGRPLALEAAALKFLLRHGLVFDERTPTGRRKGNWTRAHWSWIESIRFAEGRQRRARLLRRRGQAGGEERRGSGLVEAGPAAQVEEEGRLPALPQGRRHRAAADLVEAGEFSRFGNARSFAAWVGLTPSEHSSGRATAGAITKAGNKHLRRRWSRPRALPDVLGAAEGPRQGPGPGPGRPQACRQGRAEAGREAGGAARARGPRQQGERGHGARARLLGVGGRPHGRGGVGGPVPRT
ncbi:MAG: transposase [Collinsella sp.]